MNIDKRQGKTKSKRASAVISVALMLVMLTTSIASGDTKPDIDQTKGTVSGMGKDCMCISRIDVKREKLYMISDPSSGWKPYTVREFPSKDRKKIRSKFTAVTDKGEQAKVTVSYKSVSMTEENALRIDPSSPGFDIITVPKESEEKTETVSKASEVVELAKEICEHDPKYNYVLGGRELSSDPGHGIDCAHFVGYVFRECGIDVKEGTNDANVETLRTTLSEYTAKRRTEGSPIKLSDMEPGDIIIFFRDGHDSHTGIYIGNGQIAHAADESMGVTITDMRYDDDTGIAGYNGKTIECIIRRAVGMKETESIDTENKTDWPDDNTVITDIVLTDNMIPKKDSIELSVVVNDEIEVKFFGDGEDPNRSSQKILKTKSGRLYMTVAKKDDGFRMIVRSSKGSEFNVEPVLMKTRRTVVVEPVRKSISVE